MEGQFEFIVQVPEGCRVVGTRAAGNMVVVVCEPMPENVDSSEQRRSIGYAYGVTPEGIKRTETCRSKQKTTTRRSTTGGRR